MKMLYPPSLPLCYIAPLPLTSVAKLTAVENFRCIFPVGIAYFSSG